MLTKGPGRVIVRGLFISYTRGGVMPNIRTIVIVDDDSTKIRAAEDIVHSVFPRAMIHLVFVNGSDWTEPKLVKEVRLFGPDLLVLDNTLVPNRDVTIQGVCVARELQEAFEGMNHTCTIVANTHGVAGWNSSSTRRVFLRAADVQLGASTDAELRQVLEQIRDGEIQT